MHGEMGLGVGSMVQADRSGVGYDVQNRVGYEEDVGLSVGVTIGTWSMA